MHVNHEEAVALFRHYVEVPDRYWPQVSAGSGEHKQQRKLKGRLAISVRASGLPRDSVIDNIVSLALSRASRRPPPIYVMGLGGSGSHWLASMIAAASTTTHLTEVYIPGPLVDAMSHLPGSEQGLIVDCIYIAHALPRDGNLLDTRFINPAAGSSGALQKIWDPECSLIRLMRDPRDQVMSVTFRKNSYRQKTAPAVPDEQYLINRALMNARNYSTWHRADVKPDFFCRYEELRDSTAETLERALTASDAETDRDTIERTVAEHSEDLMRSGSVPWKGNLSSEKTRGWREEASKRQLVIMHAYLVEVVTSARYPGDECLGTPIVSERHRDATRLELPADEGTGILLMRAREQAHWTSLGNASGEVVVPPAAVLKLRIHEKASRERIKALLDYLPPGCVDSLCLAGNTAMDDGLLESASGSLRGLQELDLARTSVTDRGIGLIAPHSELRGLSLLGTEVSSVAVTELRQAIPSLAEIPHGRVSSPY